MRCKGGCRGIRRSTAPAISKRTFVSGVKSSVQQETTAFKALSWLCHSHLLNEQTMKDCAPSCKETPMKPSRGCCRECVGDMRLQQLPVVCSILGLPV
jgi:hypothetical protein